VSLIALTTDFGANDYGVGLMHGVIWKIAPAARIIDLCHDIPPQDVGAAQRLLERCAPYFPPGTIHVVVVDPGVGTQRRPLAARVGPYYFVGPDNGVIAPLARLAEARGEVMEAVHLDRPQYWLPRVSMIFHGRDIFAPAAAHMANGVGLEELGERVEEALVTRS
jgi:hypothetical protein